MIQKIKRVIRKIRSIDALKWETEKLQQQVDDLKTQNKFIGYELCRLNELIRVMMVGKDELGKVFINQTLESFDYQWKKFNTGTYLHDDKEFMDKIPAQIQTFTGFDKDWFKGKNVLDLGCGSGRYSYGLLAMGANVTSVDFSLAGIEQTKELCKEFGSRHSTMQKDILEWADEESYDLVYSFGVLHHTGNTYKAIINATKKVKKGGRLFLMVYGFPREQGDFVAYSQYEELRQRLRNKPLEEKQKYVMEKFGLQGHGWFDAVSPRINDLLTFPEIEELLTNLGFMNIKESIKSVNPHVIADKS
jgi:2-polyprenyl-3-methyl-5-hydroxy-6-metoxy-1,4-benzoquinol methylase